MCMVLAAGIPAHSQELPIDPDTLSQLTPEQKAKLAENLGTDQDQQSAAATPATPAAAKDQKVKAAQAAAVTQAVQQEQAAAPKNDQARSGNGPAARGAPALQPFGYDLFHSATSTFAPVTDIPIPADYVLGPGDTVKVQMYGAQNSSYSLVVSRDGHINFPRLGPIDVAGQRFDDVRENLEERIAREFIGVKGSVTLGELRSIQVFLLGDVNQPGSYTVSSLSTITNALIVGGGVSAVGSLRGVQLKRGGRLIRTLDLYDLLLHGNSSGDERLLPGDVIFVPPVAQRVSVEGEVKRPAIYELNGERTVGEVLRLAGGLMASTSTSTVQITRYDQNRKTVLIHIDASRAADLGSQIQDGDAIQVRQLAGPVENNVRIAGFVRYPGSFQWSQGYDLAELLRAAQVLPSVAGEETYLPLGLIERTDLDSGVRGWTSFNVHSVLTGASQVSLERDDLVVILSRKDVEYLSSRPVRAVISGDSAAAQGCAGLQELAATETTERAARFLKVFNLVGTREHSSTTAIQASTPAGQAYATAGQAYANTGQAQCPQVFDQSPTALRYLLEQSVAVYGEVRIPGLYPVTADTPLALLIETAGGLSEQSDPSSIEYVSYGDALRIGKSNYQYLDLATAEGKSRPIGPGDVLHVNPRYVGQEAGTVRVVGEFRFPSSYGILHGERLSEVMQRAGGLLDDAYPYGAVFTRQSAKEAEQASYRREAKDLQEVMVTAVTSGALGTNSQISAQFLSSIIDRLQSAEAVGRIVIDADPASLKGHPDLDPILEPGDAIYMPKRPISVTVIGQVLNPGSVQYLPGHSVKQYIDAAGGYSQAADNGRTFVILPNGTSIKVRSSFWGDTGSNIPAGSVIVVPRDATPFNSLALSERIFGILANMAVSVAALVTISKL